MIKRLTTSDPTPQWGQYPHWNPGSSPVYVSDSLRFTLSQYTGIPVLQERIEENDTIQWIAQRPMTREEVWKHFGHDYLRNMAK